jgi:phosphatidylglycerophosphate synthase
LSTANGKRGWALSLPWDQRLARLLVPPLARAGIHPNVVTSFGMLLGLGSGLLLATGNVVAMNLGACLFMFAAFIDHVDGELARTTGKTSVFGHYYDHVAVAVSYVAMFVGAGFGLTDAGLGSATIPLGIVAGVAVATIMTTRLGVEIKQGKESIQQSNIAGFEAEDTLYIVGPITWFGLLLPFVLMASIGAPLFLMWTVWRFFGARRGGKAGSESGEESKSEDESGEGDK